jgi:outer membrane protein assembly factor BamB
MNRYPALALILAVASTATASDPLAWPQFRGPGGSGVADDQKPPTHVGPDKNVRWTVSIPTGFSSPIVAGDNLVLTAFEGGKLYTIAYSRATGKEAWRAHAPAKEIEAVHKSDGDPAASTSVTDGKRIVSYFGSCGLFCYDLAGKELWRYEMPMAVTRFDFGTGVSPVLADGLVVLLRDEVNAPKILAVDLETGKRKWEKKRTSTMGFCTPAVLAASGGKQVVAAGYSKMISYDLKTGKEKWTVEGMPASTCATPVVSGDTVYFAGWSPGEDFKLPGFDEILKQAGDDKAGFLTKDGLERTPFKGLFKSLDGDKDGKVSRAEWDETLRFMAEARNSAFAVRVGGGKGDETKVLWKHKQGLPYVPSAILYRGQYLMVKDGGLVTAYDAKTGKELYVQKRSAAIDRYYASPVAANGNIYLTSLKDGAITVLKGGAEAPTVVVRNEKLGERVAATPAIADDTLYVRTETKLYAFTQKK